MRLRSMSAIAAVVAARPLAAALAVALAVTLPGCAGLGGASDVSGGEATITLPGPPGPVDAGLYTVVGRGYDTAEGTTVHIRVPPAGSDPVRDLVQGRTDFALLDIHALALARQAGTDVIGLMAIVDQPDPALRRLPAPLARRAAEPGAPRYPELVLATLRPTAVNQPGLARSVVRALVRGYGLTVTDSASALVDLQQAVPALTGRAVASELDALAPALVGARGHPGELDLPVLEAWAAWEARVGIVRRVPDVRRLFDPEFLADTGRINSAGG